MDKKEYLLNEVGLQIARENIAKQMEKDGQLTSAQLEVVLKLLDSFNSSGKI